MCPPVDLIPPSCLILVMAICKHKWVIVVSAFFFIPTGPLQLSGVQLSSVQLSGVQLLGVLTCVKDNHLKLQLIVKTVIFCEKRISP